MRALIDDKDVSCSSVDKDISVDKSDNYSVGVNEKSRQTVFSLRHLDSGFASHASGHEHSCHSPDLEGAHIEARQNAMMKRERSHDSTKNKVDMLL